MVARMGGLAGQVVVITGGAGGLGRASAAAFLAEEARVVLLDRNADAATSAAQALGGECLGLGLDVRDADAVSATMAEVVARLGRLDVLVNNAGLAIRRPTLDLDAADWQTVIDVNLTGAFLCAREAARQMLREGAEPGARAIVNIASIMGLSGGGLYPNISYQTSKGGLVNMTRALAVEWARQGLRVNAVAPTWVDTELIAPLKENPEFVAGVERLTPMARLAQPHEVADAVLFLASSRASMITGHVLPVDGGFLAQ